jgi:hypothetical protein
MRLTIEHALRTGYLQRSLSIPFSLLLESVWDSTINVVLTVTPFYGRGNKFLLKKWQVSNINKDQMLPPSTEKVISPHQVFDGTTLIIDDFATFNYDFDDYDFASVPEHDAEAWIEKEQDRYQTLMSEFYNNSTHKQRRANVLWHHFAKGYLGEMYQKHLSFLSFDSQQEIIKTLSPRHWSSWLLWQKHLLDFKSLVAAELVFENWYEQRIRENIEYQTKMNEKMSEHMLYTDDELAPCKPMSPCEPISMD